MELDGLKVVHGGLEATATDLAAIVARIDGRLRQLDVDLGPLRTGWVGDAQAAYVLARSRWDTAVGEMRDLLQATAGQVARSNEEYRAADARGARSFDL